MMTSFASLLLLTGVFVFVLCEVLLTGVFVLCEVLLTGVFVLREVLLTGLFVSLCEV